MFARRRALCNLNCTAVVVIPVSVVGIVLWRVGVQCARAARLLPRHRGGLPYARPRPAATDGWMLPSRLARSGGGGGRCGRRTVHRGPFDWTAGSFVPFVDDANTNRSAKPQNQAQTKCSCSGKRTYGRLPHRGIMITESVCVRNHDPTIPQQGRSGRKLACTLFSSCNDVIHSIHSPIHPPRSHPPIHPSNSSVLDTPTPARQL